MPLSFDATLSLRTRQGGRIIAVSDLRVIAARDNYSEVILADGSQMLLRKTLKSWQEALPASHFARVHRTKIVNVASIERYEREEADRTRLYLTGLAKPIEASRRTWGQLRARLTALHTVV